MLKRYQVAEKQNNKWLVLIVQSQMEWSWQIRGSIDSIEDIEYNTAAEAQERANELNEEHGYEPTNNE
jgi:hypothetical protein